MRSALLLSLLLFACRPVDAPVPCESSTDCPDGWICPVASRACEAPPDLTLPPTPDLYEEPAADQRRPPADMTTSCTDDFTCKVGQVCCKGMCNALQDTKNCGACGRECTAAPLCCKRGDGTYGCTDVLVGCR